MKPRNREVNIFNLSMLDVISGAMGAFLIVMVILLPYYKKENIDYQRELQQSRAAEVAAKKTAQAAEMALHQAEESVRTAQADAEQNRRRADTASRQLAKTFLLVHIQWDTKFQDVDLHVVDPAGTEFSYEHRTYPNQPGSLSVDSQYGPGNEVWSIADAPPGEYRIYANLYNPRDVNETPTVTANVIHRDGATALPPLQLRLKQVNSLIATVKVGADGRVSIQ